MEWQRKALSGLGEVMEEKYKNAVRFFKENKKYHRILKEIQCKYKSRGTVGGIIELHNINEEERMLLCKIDSKFIHSLHARFSIAKFLKTFEGTNLEGLDFVEVLSTYFGEELKTNSEVKAEKDIRRYEFFTEILADFEGTKAYYWLDGALKSKSFGYMLLLKEYDSDKLSLKNTLTEVMKAINMLNEDNFVRLAIFASQTTKNPHYFDKAAAAGKLLISALAFLKGSDVPQNTEAENELLYSYGIIKDEISNYTTASFITAYGDDGIHNGIEDFNKRNEPVMLSLWNLCSIKAIKCNDSRIYVFENPTVFSEVLARTSEQKPSLLCTNGQLRLASIVLLDKLAHSVEQIYYSGDFDPEGIKIACRLKQRYGDKLVFWRYDINAYNAVKSSVEFDEKRWKQIEFLTEESLTQLINEMGKQRRCGYQELLIEEYVKDITERRRHG